MNKRNLLKAIPAAAAIGALPAWLLAKNPTSTPTPHVSTAMSFTPLKKSKAEWKTELDAQRYAILFKEATEPAGSSTLNHEKRAGTFICAACNLPLFSSEAKYESGTGWPSFFQPIHASHIGTKTDYKIIYPRTEYHCAHCGGHQGHVFKDGPQPTGLRYCNNGLALRFIPATAELPPLVS